MKLASLLDANHEMRSAVALSQNGTDLLVDINRAYAAYLRERRGDGRAQALADALAPTDMRLLLEGGDDSLAAVRDALDFARDVLKNADALAAWTRAGRLHQAGDFTWLAPVPRPGKIISVGANYRVHLDEFKPEEDTSEKGAVGRRLARAKTPPAFGKMPSGLVGHEAKILYPQWTKQLDYETELGIVIGRRSKNLTRENWHEAVVGYTIMNDVSMRETQFEEMARGTLMLGKNADTACPAGPWLVTRDEIPDPNDLRIRCWVNGEIRQDDTTRKMIFDVPTIVAFYSQMTLHPGDMFTTGSPGGVAIAHKPPEEWLLKPGDVIEMEIEGLGRLRNEVVASS